MSGHAAPFYCPYCGEENIRPWGEKPAQYRCGDCLRAWTLKLAGTTASTEADGQPPPRSAHRD